MIVSAVVEAKKKEKENSRISIENKYEWINFLGRFFLSSQCTIFILIKTFQHFRPFNITPPSHITLNAVIKLSET